MQRLKTAGTALLAALSTIGFALYFTGSAQAQIEAGANKGHAYCIIQNDQVVGEVYVPARLPDQTHYGEHWVLFPEYVYPNPTNGQVLHVEACEQAGRYEDVDEFFASVPWGAGFRYIHVMSYDTSYGQNPGIARGPRDPEGSPPQIARGLEKPDGSDPPPPPE